MIKELIEETLKPNGKWSIKRLSAFTSVIYALIPLFKPFKVHEFVFVGLLTYSATSLGLTVWNKKIDK
jgi:hypothetical protein